MGSALAAPRPVFSLPHAKARENGNAVPSQPDDNAASGGTTLTETLSSPSATLSAQAPADTGLAGNDSTPAIIVNGGGFTNGSGNGTVNSNGNTNTTVIDNGNSTSVDNSTGTASVNDSSANTVTVTVTVTSAAVVQTSTNYGDQNANGAGNVAGLISQSAAATAAPDSACTESATADAGAASANVTAAAGAASATADAGAASATSVTIGNPESDNARNKVGNVSGRTYYPRFTKRRSS
ncbi:hypothetical protein C0995_006221 [Termitomyces sp. Mi166|nr:hypothetical protein C0995_006221 [Termitomyces sp. Mi166\